VVYDEDLESKFLLPEKDIRKADRKTNLRSCRSYEWLKNGLLLRFEGLKVIYKTETSK